MIHLSDSAKVLSYVGRTWRRWQHVRSLWRSKVTLFFNKRQQVSLFPKRETLSDRGTQSHGCVISRHSRAAEEAALICEETARLPWKQCRTFQKDSLFSFRKQAFLLSESGDRRRWFAEIRLRRVTNRRSYFKYNFIQYARRIRWHR